MGLGKTPEVLNGYNWELYNIKDDYSESDDLAAKMPDKLHKLQSLFMSEAARYNVFPLDNSVVQRILAPRPSATANIPMLSKPAPTTSFAMTEIPVMGIAGTTAATARNHPGPAATPPGRPGTRRT